MRKYSSVLDELFIVDRGLIRLKDDVMLDTAYIVFRKKTGNTKQYPKQYSKIRIVQSLLIDFMYKRKHDTLSQLSEKEIDVYCNRTFSINFKDIQEKYIDNDFFSEFNSLDVTLIQKKIFRNFYEKFLNLSKCSNRLNTILSTIILDTIESVNESNGKTNYKHPSFKDFAEIFLTRFSDVESQIKRLTDVNDKAVLLKLYLLSKIADEIDVADSVK